MKISIGESNSLFNPLITLDEFEKAADFLTTKYQTNDLYDDVGRTLLMYAVLVDSLNIVMKILRSEEAPIIIDKQDKPTGFTALHFASQEWLPEISQALINAGASLDIKDKFGNTPLQKATYYSRGRGDIITQLLKAGADPHLQNNYGVSPYSLAQQFADGNDALKFFAEFIN